MISLTNLTKNLNNNHIPNRLNPKLASRVNEANKRMPSGSRQVPKKVLKFTYKNLDVGTKKLAIQTVENHFETTRTRGLLNGHQNQRNFNQKVTNPRLPSFEPIRNQPTKCLRSKSIWTRSLKRKRQQNRALLLPKLSIEARKSMRERSSRNYRQISKNKKGTSKKNNTSDFSDLTNQSNFSDFTLKIIQNQKFLIKSKKIDSNLKFSNSTKMNIRQFKSIERKKNKKFEILEKKKKVELYESYRFNIDEKKNNDTTISTSVSNNSPKKEYKTSAQSPTQNLRQKLKLLPLAASYEATSSGILSESSSKISAPINEQQIKEKLKTSLINQNLFEEDFSEYPEEPPAPNNRAKKATKGGFSSYTQKALTKKKFRRAANTSEQSSGVNGIDFDQKIDSDHFVIAENLQSDLRCPKLPSLSEEDSNSEVFVFDDRDTQESKPDSFQKTSSSLELAVSSKKETPKNLEGKIGKFGSFSRKLIVSSEDSCSELQMLPKSILVNKNFHLPAEMMHQRIQMIEISTKKDSKLLLPLWELEQVDDNLLYNIRTYELRLSQETNILPKLKGKDRRLKWNLTKEQILNCENSRPKLRASSPSVRTMKNKECVVKAQECLDNALFK